TVLVGNSSEAMDAADRDIAVEGGFAAYIYKRTLDDIYDEDNTVDPGIHPQAIMQDVVDSYEDDDTLEFGIVNRGRINNWRMGRVTFIDREQGLSQDWLIMEVAQETYILALTYAPMDEGQLFQSPLLGILDTLDYTYIQPEEDEANSDS
ncbi:MAG: hypothetical protein KC496_21820, partial [Anaerolineae bacterium]|nr:hypothetical protein [Anaerolineae bacterium]